jgi:pyruvate-formate lyase-activating enzyme
MTKYKWLRLREYEDLVNVDLKVGDKFLYGTAMINQKDSKEIGQQIVYFEVIKAEGKNIEYTQIFDTLEEDRLDGKRN